VGGFGFLLQSVARIGVCWRSLFPAAIATAGFILALIFIFFDPCAGRHSLSLLRQRKQRKAHHTTPA
jgi:hypothetical protein